ncbi:MAG: hypothetical protein UV71_C0007G0029 [Microgenomates group bacterium GW2011_GWC1_43_13]|uniref:Mannosyl-glycoprotein endo-beta-N-acetylglucosamidase-like domain-containing protein n=3 Tax=Candidatus Woeseibacteriota TaxID=1752722 RepID=A0A837IJQ6_9BACT|nr:MAG: hypothetical protein UV71_C0007G0029 [Microgenomates group bacterium GW2011_GWC1_43_13]KKT32631.1 MAG: hypothetical protein UW20_C0011G0001 [Candidatus Woesebacteria bacterium GW2011_GWB1_44_11]KKT54205.1 MAG: hypothetical protein UW47_C0008G0004 [Candidatus Woesebacteria bacterium GW2011_GWA1_44_23]OGM76261.1 MAG: hypothetical protein A2208_02280 [Candidatus Woesebacteria bacterium RIFOXYA1_FULL_43_16]OGM82324.1 MAG: hypothetical protein A2394_01860 [Candidatus Woesebacteria bacterium 
MVSDSFTREENIGFWKNLILVTAFFVVTPLTLGISLYSLFSFKSNTAAREVFDTANLIVSPQSGIKVYASLPTVFPTVSEQISSSDARSEILRQYMENYGSPLALYSGLIVQTADKYSLDFRLITAIAQQESNICKIIPPGSYNCWGWGIHSNGSLGFKSFDEGIEEVSRGLRTDYLNKGYTTVNEIMGKYTPLSNGSWADGVNEFMSEME